MDERQESSDVGKENYNFVQMNRAYLKQYRELVKKSSISIEILTFFLENMGRTSNALVCSYQTLMDVTGYSRATIGRALKVLKDDNWIEIVKIGSATAYCVNARAFWQAARNQKQYAIFQATVIAGMDEQESNYRDLAKKPLKNIPIFQSKERIVVGGEKLPPPDQEEMNLD